MSLASPLRATTHAGPMAPLRAGQVLELVFLLTFPGYFVYHYLVSQSLLPGFLAGYSTPICLITLPGLLAYHAVQVLNRPTEEPRLIERTLWAFLLYYALVAGWQLATRNLKTGAEAHPTVILQFIAMFLLGRYVACDARQRGLLLALVLAMSAMIVHFATTGGLLAATLEAFGVPSDSLISYQGYAFAYFVTLSWLVPQLMHRPWLRASIYAIAFVALFLNGARSEFAAAVLACAGLEWFLTRSKGSAMVWAAGAVMVFALAYLVFQEEVQDYRVITIFTDYDDDLSVQDRKGMYEAGLRSILAHPLTGDFGSYVAGEYVHSYLSAWVDLGIVGFGGFLLLSALPMAQLWVARRRLRDDPQLQLLFILGVSSLLLSIAAKPFTQYLLPLTLGVAARSAAALGAQPAPHRTAPHPDAA